MLDNVADFIIANINPRVIAVTAIVTVLVFLLVKFIRQGRSFKTNVGECIRSATSVLMIFSGLQILSVFLLKNPHPFDRLSEDDILLIGLVGTIVCCFIGVLELCKVLFVETASAVVRKRNDPSN